MSLSQLLIVILIWFILMSYKKQKDTEKSLPVPFIRSCAHPQKETQVKYMGLGVTIPKGIKWDNHISNTTNKTYDFH